MPHIILEHSANIKSIDYQTLFNEIETNLPAMGTYKMRAMAYDHYVIGQAHGETAFVFLRMLMAPRPERDDAFKEHISQQLIPIIKHYITPVLQDLNLRCSPTVEVGFLSRQYYWLTD